MPKSTKRKPAPRSVVNPKLEAKRAEKRELARFLRECRAVDALARKVKRTVETADYHLRELSGWLAVRGDAIEAHEDAATGTEG